MWVRSPTGKETTFESSGLARVATTEMSVGGVTLDNGETIDITKTVFGEIEGLPEPKMGVMYIVSMVVAQRANRPDLICPDTFKRAIRNEKGETTGTRGFVQY